MFWLKTESPQTILNLGSSRIISSSFKMFEILLSLDMILLGINHWDTLEEVT